jgi:hypothetical protein
MRTLATIAVVAALLVLPARLRAADQSLLMANASSQAIQNEKANEFHLSRMRNRAMIRRFYRAGLLVRVPTRTRNYYLHGIPSSYHYLRPWTKLFLTRLSRQYHARFGQRLRVTSMIRTVYLQRRLTRRNPNAVRATGPDRSSHLTGATLDISKRFMSARGQRWMRHVLLRLERSGYLYAIEEFEEPCFHIMVYPTYRRYVERITHRTREVADRRR